MTDERAVRLALDAARVTAERDELEAAIDRVRRLHSQEGDIFLAEGKWCPGCGEEEPCPTVRALNGQAQKPGRFG